MAYRQDTQGSVLLTLLGQSPWIMATCRLADSQTLANSVNQINSSGSNGTYDSLNHGCHCSYLEDSVSQGPKKGFLIRGISRETNRCWFSGVGNRQTFGVDLFIRSNSNETPTK